MLCFACETNLTVKHDLIFLPFTIFFLILYIFTFKYLFHFSKIKLLLCSQITNEELCEVGGLKRILNVLQWVDFICKKLKHDS